MKDLYLYIMEEGEGGVVAAPGNTMGMGNPTPPGEGGEPGSEPMITAKTKIHIKNKKKKRTLVESLLDDEEDLINDNSALIEQFLKDNYNIRGTYTIKNGVVDVNGNIEFSSELDNLTNDLFRFGVIEGNLSIHSVKLKSLKGSPNIINGKLDLAGCINLTSLEHCPHHVSYSIDLYNCKNLKSLKGLPQTFRGNLNISHCEAIENLEGCPNKISGVLLANWCYGLTSLKGCPKSSEYFFEYCVKLTNFIGLPKTQNTCVKISNAKLKNLKGLPEKMSLLDVSDCELNNFIGGPKTITGDLYICRTKINDITGFPEYIGGNIIHNGVSLPPNIHVTDLKK